MTQPIEKPPMIVRSHPMARCFEPAVEEAGEARVGRVERRRVREADARHLIPPAPPAGRRATGRRA